MLVLSREPGQEVVIGDNVRVLVVTIGPGKVRLGIEAPRDVPVHRRELYESIKAAGFPRLAADQPVTHDGGPDIADGAPSDGTFTTNDKGRHDVRRHDECVY